MRARDPNDDFLKSAEGIQITRRSIATIHAVLDAPGLRDSEKVLVRVLSGEGYRVRVGDLRRFYRLGAGSR